MDDGFLPYLSDFLFPWQAAQHPAPLPWPTDSGELFVLACTCPASLDAPCDCTAISYPTAWFFVAYDLTMLAVMYSFVRWMARRYRMVRSVGGRIVFDLVSLVAIVLLGLILFGIGVLLRDAIPR